MKKEEKYIGRQVNFQLIKLELIFRELSTIKQNFN